MSATRRQNCLPTIKNSALASLVANRLCCNARRPRPLRIHRANGLLSRRSIAPKQRFLGTLLRLLSRPSAGRASEKLQSQFPACI